MGPLGGYEAVEDPWWGFLRLTVRPAHWIQVGVSRAALAGGRFEGGSVAFDPVTYPPDEGSLSAADVLRILVAKPTDYDNQLAALDVRVSAAGIGAPLLAYAEFGVEDTDRSWGDPALLAGVLWAPAFPVPLALRYEYVAFGRGARLCGWCDTLPAYLVPACPLPERLAGRRPAPGPPAGRVRPPALAGRDRVEPRRPDARGARGSGDLARALESPGGGPARLGLVGGRRGRLAPWKARGALRGLAVGAWRGLERGALRAADYRLPVRLSRVPPRVVNVCSLFGKNLR